MPTVLLIDGFAIKINTADHLPAHVHVWKAGKEAKIYLDPVTASAGYSLSLRDLVKAAAIVKQNQVVLMSAWERYHG